MDQNSFVTDANNRINFSYHHDLKSIYEPTPFEEMLSQIQMPAIVFLFGILILCVVFSLIKHKSKKLP